MKLVLYPDPILRQVAPPLETIDARVRDRVREMFAIMYDERGIGLAAPQVGWSARLFIINVEGDPDEGEERVYINPRIVSRSGEIADEEGCLSIPNVRGKVTRSKTVRVRAQNLDGEVFEEEVEDLHARAIQHELDHIDGILFIQRLSSADQLAIKSALRKLAGERDERSSALG